MAILIGGPLHGKKMKVNPQAKTLQIAMPSNDRQPKQQRHGFFVAGTYERTRLIRDGEQVYRFLSGYYPPREYELI